MTAVGRERTKQELVHERLRERILDGTYGPGHRMVIDALAREHGVSALPVREAVRRLEAEGLVVFRANAGAQVTPADPSAFGDELTVLAVLEGYATALTAPHLEAADLVELEALTDVMAERMETMDTLGFGDANQRFHSYLYDRCPNPRLVERLHESARRLDAIRRTVFLQIPYRGRESIREHRELLELLRGDAGSETIERAARDHKLRTAESFAAWRADRASHSAHQELR